MTRRKAERTDAAPAATQRSELSIRPVRRGDLDAVIAIDTQVTGLEKRDYWRSVYRRYGEAAAAPGAQFLVAEAAARLAAMTGAALQARRSMAGGAREMSK